MRAVTVVGPGRMGLALASALLHTDSVADVTVFGRRPEPPSHPLFTQGRARYVFGVEPLQRHTQALFLAVPDSVVPEMAFTIAAQGPAPPGCAAFHLSASLPTDVLSPLHGQGYAMGSFHPLQSVVHPVSAADRLPGSYIAVIGSPEATAVARQLAAGMGSPVINVPAARRPLFHAGVVLASTYLPPVLDLAARLLERAGVTSDEALPALLPLAQGTLSSITERGLHGSVRGPIAAVDLDTLDLHLRALEPAEQKLYAVIGLHVVEMLGAELDPESRRSLVEHLQRYG